MESLQDKIDKSLVESEFDKSDFLPQSSFDELITTASIDAGMRFAGLSPALANEISRSSRRLFAILAYMDMVNAIESLHQEGFTDQYLPVDLVSDGDSQEIISLPNDKHDKTIFLSFTQPPWNRTKRRDFYNKQWLVQSPVFATLGQEFNLNERCPLPFISVEDTKRGHFSRVYKVRVHHAHLQVFVPPVSSFWSLKVCFALIVSRYEKLSDMLLSRSQTRMPRTTCTTCAQSRISPLYIS